MTHGPNVASFIPSIASGGNAANDSATDKPRDQALALRWVPDREWLDRLALPKTTAKRATARAAILAQAYQTSLVDPERWISYARRVGWYSEKGRRYLGGLGGFRIVVGVIDELAALGLVENAIAFATSQGGPQSVFRASAALRSAPPPTKARPAPSPGDTIILRARGDGDERGALLPYRDTARTIEWRRSLAAINEAIGSVSIGFDATVPVQRIGGLIKIGERVICPDLARLRRSFSVDWEHGGRFYAEGGYWQTLPKAYREGLTINGAAVAEPDFFEIHPTLLAAGAGLEYEGSAYSIPGAKPFRASADVRKAVKRAWNIMVNAESRHGAIVALAKKLNGDALPIPPELRAYAAGLVDLVERHHAATLRARWFYSGIGRRLQRIDSDITERVLHALLKRGVVALPVHDSYVVPVRHKGLTVEIMDREMARTIADLKARKISIDPPMRATA